MAESLQSALIDKLDVKSRDVTQGDYQVLPENKRLAARIELGFISNPNEHKQAQSKLLFEKTANAVVTALKNYFSKS